LSLPKLSLKPASARQRERLEHWLVAWEIDRDLRLPAQVSPGTGVQDLPVSPISAEPPPEPGQVRLFSPEVEAANDRLLYVAVLAMGANTGLLVAPYSRFSEPCVPGELLTGRDTASLKVVCLWNAINVPAAVLARSWVVDALSENELEAAIAVRRHLVSEDVLPSELAERVGPPLWHPADPRRQYLDEERRTMESLLGGSGGVVEYPTLTPARPIAADPHDPYGSAPLPE